MAAYTVPAAVSYSITHFMKHSVSTARNIWRAPVSWTGQGMCLFAIFGLNDIHTFNVLLHLCPLMQSICQVYKNVGKHLTQM